MDKSEIESLLRDHVRSVHVELETLFRGVGQALDRHLADTEKAIARSARHQQSAPDQPGEPGR